ncbi:MAG TPA: MXAN_2562 family outer membrane beta-barrel protein, partial [Anaeromyxobacteraceae bacterium]
MVPRPAAGPGTALAAKAAAAVAILALAAPALAESPRWGAFDLQASGYRPDIDSEFQGAASPYADIFGGGRPLLWSARVSRSLFSSWGSLDLGVGVGWWSKSGKGLLQSGGPSGDSTALRVLPVQLSLTYRLDAFADAFPFVPYGRLALERWHWWVTNGGGGTASEVGGPEGSGATNGWSVAGGLAFLLDFLDPHMAREMYRD